MSRKRRSDRVAALAVCEEAATALQAVGTSLNTATDSAQGHAAASEQVAAPTREVLAGVDEVSNTAASLQHYAARLCEAVGEFRL